MIQCNEHRVIRLENGRHTNVIRSFKMFNYLYINGNGSIKKREQF